MKRKNRFFTFIFAFIPGCAHMYLGLMKRGVSIMGLFGLVIFAINMFRIEILAIILPVLWFYSFFDALNYNNIPYERKELIEDNFLFLDIKSSKTRDTLIGWGLMFIGLGVLYGMFIEPILSDFLRSIGLARIAHNIPTVIVAGFITLIGFKLIGKKESVEDIREESKDFNSYTDTGYGYEKKNNQ